VRLSGFMDVLFCPDLGVAAGLGHLARCSALAAAIGRAGGRPSFAAGEQDLQLLTGRGLTAHLCGDGASSAPERVLASDVSAFDVVVLDSYHLAPAHLEALRRRNMTVVVIDDLARVYAPSDIVVNGAAHAAKVEYGDPRAGALLLGPRYVLIGAQYAAPPRVLHVDRVQSVLVSLGGGDPLGMMADLLRHVRQAVCPDVEVRALIGPYFPAEWHGEAATERWHSRGVTLHAGSGSIRDSAAGCDLAVSAAGITLYELAAMGIPTVAFSIAENQRPQLAMLSVLGSLESVGDAGDAAFWVSLEASVRQVSESAAARQRLGTAARELVDGYGADRVAAAIAATCGMAPSGSAET
jgi:UDP-2,4-diacetamido-2,4,6-trideoxy-beta-L-altropyranose hydrolase